MKICILGAGALGCAIGAALAESGVDLWLLNRSPAHVAAMQAQGLIVQDTRGERTVRVQAATRAEGIGPVDLVVVLVKSFHTAAAMRGAAALIGPHTLVLSLQNGLGHEDILADAVGRERVLAGKTYVGGVFVAPGRVAAGVAGKHTVIGELDGTVRERTRRIAAELERAGLATQVSDDITGAMWDKLLVNVATGAVSGIPRLATTVSENIQGAIWDKLLVNVATGALSGITGLPYGALYEVPEIEACAVAAVAEAMAVARAAGIAITTTDPREPWRKASAGLSPAFKASMLQSLEKGSITEIDYVNGSVVRWGRRTGVPTPVNHTLVACIKGRERRLTHSIPSP